MTCLFDSMNFLLDTEDLYAVLRQFSNAMADDGILYFDVVTERMVTDHFEDQSWSESNGRFTTTWSSTYDRKTCIADTTVKVGNSVQAVLQERIYPLSEIENALSEAGLELIGTYDAETWKKPDRKTLRIEFVCVKQNTRELRKKLKGVSRFISALLK